ncbi:MAG: peptide chain release factor N(5)-glutamine methyltransferase [Treponema sp.]|jgi:release factor glutamine methyltransferase|nr:peptide chain release factor N(5)-glutamine methyltransferase [Treponema sp.]
MTVQAAQVRGTRLLASAGLDNPALDSSLLLAETLGLDRSRLILAYPNPLPDSAGHRFEELLRRRLAGESVAYILGRKEFRGLEFAVSPAVLVPRPDTETLVEAALSFLASPPSRPAAPAPGNSLLDLCTGSGAVAIALKHEAADLEVWASDISPEALKIARQNAARLLRAALGPPRNQNSHNEKPDPVDSPAVTLIQSDLFDRITGVFHLITANPPYVKSAEIAGLSAEVRGEPRIALDGGPDGLCLIRRIIAGAPEHLHPGGALLLEAEPRQMKSIRNELEKHGFIGIQTYRDLSGAERVTGGITK